jgi:membrane-associated phospholipid phosphatase
MPFFEKYGKRIHLGPERLHSTSVWFEKYGNKLLVIALFIPGVRHFTGYFSGITRLPFRIYLSFAVLGSLIWVSTFIILGKMLGPKWEIVNGLIKQYLLVGSIILVFIIALAYLVKNYRNEIIKTSMKVGKLILDFFRSRRKAELFIALISVATIGFIILMIGIIQDYFSNEINDFDDVTNLLVSVIFKGKVDFLMNLFLRIGTSTVLLCLIFYTLIWILWKGKEKLLEIYFLGITICGGEVYEGLMRNIFNTLSPNEPSLLEHFPYSFPSEQSLMAFVIYGFFFFILLRHSKQIRVHTVLIFIWMCILIFIGISRIYFNLQEPSQIVAGYVFGGVWLGLCTLLLEIFRMLMNIETQKKKNAQE